MKNILVILPVKRDRRELDLLKDKYGCRFIYHGDDPRNCLEDFDINKFVESALYFIKNKKISAVIASHDYPAALMGSIISQKLGLPCPKIEKILICQHKYYCRQYQKKYVPEAYVESKIVDPLKDCHPPFDFPFFIKPVKSFFSIMAAEIKNINQYKKYLLKAKTHICNFSAPFNKLFKSVLNFKYGADYLIAESLLKGRQVTLEAYSFNNVVRVIGIVDSIMHRNKISFKRFDYPSSLKKEAQMKMEEIAVKFIKKIGFDNGILNIEFFYNPKNNEIKIIEVNPRMCSQFADIMEKVNGINTYEIQLFLSLGLNPDSLYSGSEGIYKYASSFVLRKFEDKKITKLPSEIQIKSLKEIYPDARIEIYGKEGCLLSEELNDMKSYRYAILNLGADSRKELKTKYAKCLEKLDFKFEDPL